MPVFHLRATTLAVAAIASTVPLAAQPGAPDRGQSRYWQLAAPVTVFGPTTVRSETINLTAPGRLLVQADGHVLPVSWPSAASAWAWITVDGQTVSNTTVEDWQGSIAPQPHAFATVGAVSVSAGTHVVALQADARNGIFDLGSAGLTVFVNPAAQVVMAQLPADSSAIQPSYPTRPGASRCAWSNIPWSKLVSLDMPTADLPVYTFAAGRTQVIANAGDSMLGILHEHSDVRGEGTLTWRGAYSVQDLWPAAEIHSALSCQGVLYGAAPSAEYRPRLWLAATEFPPSNHPGQPLSFKVGSGATIVGVAGGMQVHGAVAKTNGPVCQAMCFGGSGSGCPAVATPVVLSYGTIRIPSGHDGRVFISGKARVQGDSGDTAARSSMRIRLNGQYVGTNAVQGVGGWLGGWDSTLSQRTLGVSYLATGALALPAGDHLVELVVQLNPYANPARTERMSIWDDDPMLVWID